MCGTLKYEGVADKIGNPVLQQEEVIVVTQDNLFIQSKWLGFHRQENSKPTGQNIANIEEVKIYAKEYTEYDSKTKADVTFRVPEGKAISAYLIGSETYPGGSGVFIQTRQASEEELKKCNHRRHPVLVDK